MDVSTVKLPRISVMGKVGRCTTEHNAVQELWAEANAHFPEVMDLAMKEADGSFVGFWGAMSDEQMKFLPWEDNFSRGLYLAGVEVYEDTLAPEGWTKWTMPARTYLVTDVTPESYMERFREVIEKVIPGMQPHLSGAVCDFTDPRTGQNKLFFPVTE